MRPETEGKWRTAAAFVVVPRVLDYERNVRGARECKGSDDVLCLVHVDLCGWGVGVVL